MSTKHGSQTRKGAEWYFAKWHAQVHKVACLRKCLTQIQKHKHWGHINKQPSDGNNYKSAKLQSTAEHDKLEKNLTSNNMLQQFSPNV